MLELRPLIAPRMWLLAVLVTASGCHRAAYREEADQEVCEIVAEKSDDDRWAIENFDIEPDARSRYADVYDKDFPPMPPDDPASHQLMHCIDGMEHWDGWHDSGNIDDLESPGWLERLSEYTPINDDGRIRLGLNDAVKLSVLHSPSYQQQLETLYLSALDVSTERFRFDVQFFGGNATGFNHLGEERAGGESNLFSTNSDAQLRRRFATAGELLIGFANSLTWEFMGPNGSTASSVVDFAFVQPLLRAGGRAIALEQLTIAERGLLANLRTFQRYRQGFYTNVAIGNLGVGQVQRRGGFFGGTGLTGFTGQGAGGLGGVGAATGFGGGFGGAGGAAGGGTAGLAGGGAGSVGGFIGLLQQLQQIRNTETSLTAQLRTLALLEANLEAGLIDIAQVDQFRQNIETERANLLQAKNSLETSLDTFKRTTLGLPPNLAVDLDDSMIQPFQLIDPTTNGVQAQIGAYIDEFGELPEQPTAQQFAAVFTRVEALRSSVSEHLTGVNADLATLDKSLETRLSNMTETEGKILRLERQKMQTVLDELATRVTEASAALTKIKDDLTDENRESSAVKVVELLTELSNIIGDLGLVQARARLESITLDPIEISEALAMQIARTHRLDWMNNRAALVDTWRLIEFNANALKSDVSIRFSGDMQTIGNDNPTKFRGQTGAMRASLQIDPPFTRLLERNNFRQQLIQYQQDRRQLIQFEDQVRGSVRQIIREINQLKVNMEIQRRAVAIAIRRMEQTREALNQPVPPTPPGELPRAFGPTAAQNLLLALSDLRNTQNNLMSVWLNYLESRMLLNRELGIMQVDSDNLWVDVPLADAINSVGFEIEEIPAIPKEWIRDLKRSPNLPPAPAEGGEAPNDAPPKLLPVPEAEAKPPSEARSQSTQSDIQQTSHSNGEEGTTPGWQRLGGWLTDKLKPPRMRRREVLMQPR